MSVGNIPGVRFAYDVACQEAVRAGAVFPTLDEVMQHCPTLDTSFVLANLEREGHLVAAGLPVTQGLNGTRPVFDRPVQLAPGESPVIRTQNGIRPAFDVPFKNACGQTVIRTLNGIRVVPNR